MRLSRNGKKPTAGAKRGQRGSAGKPFNAEIAEKNYRGRFLTAPCSASSNVGFGHKNRVVVTEDHVVGRTSFLAEVEPICRSFAARLQPRKQDPRKSAVSGEATGTRQCIGYQGT